MKNLLRLSSFIFIALYSCSPGETLDNQIINTENSILITGINESISYTFTSKNGRTESSVPDDVNMIQILILDSNNELVYEQYHYNQNAYNEHYYDSAEHGGDDYTFENTLPDTLYIPPLADGDYTVLASTAYTTYYDYYYGEDGADSAAHAYPFIDAYHVTDAPIFVGKASATVSAESDAVVVLDMQNISARIDLNITSSYEDWSMEIHMETEGSKYYSFESESLEATDYDYGAVYIWRDAYWKQNSFYFLPKSLKNINLWYYEYSSNFNMNFEADIDPDLAMEPGDVFVLNIDLDELREGGGSAGFSWDTIDWNNVGEVTIP